MRTKKSLRKRLNEGETLWGSWLQCSSPASTEVLARIGYDWLAVDCEHTETTIEMATHMCRAGQALGAGMLMRVRSDNPLDIRQALDGGADGVIVPLVDTVAQAKAVVNAAKYPPLGHRGYSYVRANRWGIDFDAYAETANDQTVVIVMIESAQSVEAVGDMLAVEGVDGAIIGPYDLSGSYGVPGKLDHELLILAQERVLQAGRDTRKVSGTNLIMPTKGGIEDAIQRGFRLIALGGDTMYMAPPARDFLDYARNTASG